MAKPSIYRFLLWGMILLLAVAFCPLAMADAPSNGLPDYRPGIADWAQTRRVEQSRMMQAPLPAPELLDFAHYPTAHEVHAFAKWLASAYPNLVSLTDLGTSWQGRPLYLLTVASTEGQPTDTRPAFYLDAQHHAREAIAQQAALYFCWWLVQSYGDDPYVTHLLNTRTLYLFAQVNPDGNDLWLTEDASLRKTANPACDDDGDGLIDEDPREGLGLGSHDRYLYHFQPGWVDEHADDIFAEGWEQFWLRSDYLGMYGTDQLPATLRDDDADGNTDEDPYGGVDPNRNYDWYWGWGDTTVGSITYRGPEPFSEPETQAVRDFILEHEPIATALSLHSGADMILYPWAYTGSYQSPQQEQLNTIAHKGSQLTACHGYAPSAYGQGAVALYAATGTTFDWLHAQGIWSWTPEIYGGNYIMLVERVDDTASYIVGQSISGLFAPSQDDILALADRWRRFFVYILAATPNLSLCGVAADEAGLWLQVANDGYLPVEIGLRATVSDQIYTTTVSISAAREWLALPFSLEQCEAGAAITLTATINVAGQSRVIEEQRLAIVVTPGQPQATLLLEGAIQPWVDLSPLFGPAGWLPEELPVEQERPLPLPQPDHYLPAIFAAR